MDVAELLVDAFGRVRETVHAVLDGIDTDRLHARPDAEANPIAWLVWHLTRVQDDHVCGVAGVEQTWTAGGFARRFGLPLPDADHGYGHSAQDVAAVRVEGPELLQEYFDAVHDRTLAYVGGLVPADLDRVVDERWDPPVTLGVRLVSVVDDDIQHAGQAAYLRGLLDRA
jgi:Protein of unknown function (DUF664)